PEEKTDSGSCCSSDQACKPARNLATPFCGSFPNVSVPRTMFGAMDKPDLFSRPPAGTALPSRGCPLVELRTTYHKEKGGRKCFTKFSRSPSRFQQPAPAISRVGVEGKWSPRVDRRRRRGEDRHAVDDGRQPRSSPMLRLAT